jgi:hypothetical protein
MSVQYLTLVNDVQRETGQNLTDLTSVTFGTTTNSMQIKIKNWVKQAWRDIQASRRNWHFMRRRGLYILQPRIDFYDGNSATSTSFDNAVLEDTNGNWSLKANGVHYLESGVWASGTAKGWLNVTDYDGTLPVAEYIKPTDKVERYSAVVQFDTFFSGGDTFLDSFAVSTPVILVPSNTPVGVVTARTSNGSIDYTVTITLVSGMTVTELVAAINAGQLLEGAGSGQLEDVLSSSQTVAAALRVLGWGRYRLDDTGPDTDADSAITDVQEVDYKTFNISPYAGAAGDDFSDDYTFAGVYYVTPEVWKANGYSVNAALGTPQIFTIDYDGKYAFHPQPDKAYVLAFDYWKTPQVLTEYNDVIEGISDYYADAILWLACQYWAEYDESAQLQRMQRRARDSMTKLVRDYSDRIGFPQGMGAPSFG